MNAASPTTAEFLVDDRSVFTIGVLRTIRLVGAIELFWMSRRASA
jgi:hypothetical protein